MVNCLCLLRSLRFRSFLLSSEWPLGPSLNLSACYLSFAQLSLSLSRVPTGLSAELAYPISFSPVAPPSSSSALHPSSFVFLQESFSRGLLHQEAALPSATPSQVSQLPIFCLRFPSLSAP